MNTDTDDDTEHCTCYELKTGTYSVSYIERQQEHHKSHGQKEIR